MKSNELLAMKEWIKDIVENNGESVSLDEFKEIMTITDDNQELFNLAIQELLDEAELFLTKKKNRYILPHMAGYYKGVISIKNTKYGFILGETCDYYVAEEDFNGAFDKDEVLYRILPSRYSIASSLEAVVMKVIKHHTKYVVGVVVKHFGRYFVEHNEKHLPRFIRITNPQHHKEKEVVRCIITNYSYQDCDAEIVDVIGSATDIGIDIAQIAIKYDFELNFPDDVLQEARDLSSSLEDELKRRVDYRDKLIFTIDGDDAKDLDDAVSIEKLANGNYRLGVYIADVSYFVTKGSKLDDEALTRGTSVYLVDRVIPMLPVRLSNDLCSLNPNQDKLTLCCIMTIDDKGDVISSEITEGVIKTTKRLSYSKVNQLLAEGTLNVPDYEIAYDSLLLMQELATILTNKRVKRGALEFDIPEGKVIVNDQGMPIDIVLRERGVSEKIIEEFMILANETVAQTIELMDLPFIYRVHDLPNSTKLGDLVKISKSLGYNLRGRYATEIQAYLNSIHPDHDFLKTLVLRMMSKAVYSATNIGHFGLASEAYTHFTSPIRRYPDLLVHRLLRKYLFNSEIDPNEFSALNKEIEEIAQISSERERAAANCEYDVNDMKIAEYMEYHIDERFEGVISNITNFGMFVSLPNTVEGLVKAASLTDDYYRYNAQYHTMIGRQSGRKYKIGDKVKVIVVKSDKKTSEIDFKIVYNNSSRERKVGVSRGRKKYRHQK